MSSLDSQIPDIWLGLGTYQTMKLMEDVQLDDVLVFVVWNRRGVVW